MDIVKTFLGKRENYEKEFVEKLNSECLLFLELCKSALEKNAEFDKKSEFHLLCTKGYESLVIFFNEFLLK
jgi:hypothetical protein